MEINEEFLRKQMDHLDRDMQSLEQSYQKALGAKAMCERLIGLLSGDGSEEDSDGGE